MTTEHLLRVSPYARDPSEMDTALALEEPRATGGGVPIAVSSWREQAVGCTQQGWDGERPGAARPEEAPASPVVVRKGFLEEVAVELSFEG